MSCNPIGWSRAALLALLLCAAGAAQAKDVAGAADHPLVGRYDGSQITTYDVAEFDRVDLLKGALPKRFDDKGLPEDLRLRLEGKSYRIVYQAPKDRSAVEIDANFAASLKSKGFETLFSCSDQDCISGETGYYRFGSLLDDPSRNFRYSKAVAYRLARLKRPQGDVYAAILSGRSATDAIVAIRVVELKPMEEDKIAFVDAGQMQTDLDAGGRVALYGIYFDFDKADLKPESAPTLAEIAKLLQAQPGLKLIVAGHTDGKGEFAYNVALSERRSAAVVEALSRTFRIDPARLTAFGVGMAAPIESNENEAGRAKNRRVELVKR